MLQFAFWPEYNVEGIVLESRKGVKDENGSHCEVAALWLGMGASHEVTHLRVANNFEIPFWHSARKAPTFAKIQGWFSTFTISCLFNLMTSLCHVLTGGFWTEPPFQSGKTLDRVSEYNTGGFVKDLPKLLSERMDHACTSYLSSTEERVIVVFRWYTQ